MPYPFEMINLLSFLFHYEPYLKINGETINAGEEA